MKSTFIVQILLFLSTIFWTGSIAIAAPGDVDLGFNPPNFSSSFSSFSIYANVLQPDGKVVVGGSFSRVDGTTHISLARLNTDGSRDTTFISPFGTGSTGTIVSALALQTDGKILVGGTLVTPGGTKTLVRVNADGSLDTAFTVAASSVFGAVGKIVVEPDGRILASGNFSGVTRLNPNGSFVESIGTILNNITGFFLQPDGRLVIGGTASFGGDATFRFVGTDIDPTFRGGTSMILPVAGRMELQQDGKILIFGIGLVTVDGITRRGMIRLTSSGVVDTSLDMGNLGGGVQAVKLLTNGKFIGGGFFFLSGDTNGYGFARFNADGTLDSTFSVTSPDRNTNEIVRSVNIQPDGKVIITGDFTQVAGVSRSLIARLQGDTNLPNLTINNVALNEGNSGTAAFSFTVSLSSASAQTVTVNYATADGTATAPTDYQTMSGFLLFAPGETSKTVTVLVNGDTTVEANEAFAVNLSGAANATITGGTGTGTILNDDACAYSIAPTSLNVGAAGGSGNTIAVTAQAGCPYTAVSNNSFITITSGASGTGNGSVVFTVAVNPGASRTGTITVAGQTFTVNQAGSVIVRRRTPFDFDGDGIADISIYRPSSATWYLLKSTAGFSTTLFGIPSNKLVPADYDGDGKTDIAVYYPALGFWFVLKSGGGLIATQFGFGNDIPVPADYDGDGKSDIAVYRPSNGTWYILRSTAGFIATQFGFSTDKPVPADYDGDGKADIAVYRPSSGTWFFLKSTEGFSSTQFGFSTDKLVPADYDGDGKADIAVYRPSSGTWFFLKSTEGFSSTQFGFSTDKIVPADYDGDGKTDVAIFRPSNGTWFFLKSSGGFSSTQFGFSTDVPIPGVFTP